MEITELNSIKYKDCNIFVNRVKGEMPYGILVQYYFNTKLRDEGEFWFSSIPAAKDFINQNNKLNYYQS